MNMSVLLRHWCIENEFQLSQFLLFELDHCTEYNSIKKFKHFADEYFMVC